MGMSLSSASTTNQLPNSARFRLRLFTGLASAASAHILNPSNEIYLSAVSVLEIARKYARRRISLPSHPCTLILSLREESGTASRLFKESDALATGKLQLLHKDPFDRMLIAQEPMGGLAIITSDQAFEPYPVRVVRQG